MHPFVIQATKQTLCFVSVSIDAHYSDTCIPQSGIRLPLPNRSSSIDSITGEFSRYFKPIARFPRTPPRLDNKADGYPETIKVTPCPKTVKRLDFASSCSPASSAKLATGKWVIVFWWRFSCLFSHLFPRSLFLFPSYLSLLPYHPISGLACVITSQLLESVISWGYVGFTLLETTSP